MDDKTRKEIDDDLKAGGSAAKVVVAPMVHLRSNYSAMAEIEAQFADAKERLEKRKAEVATAAAAADAAKTTAALKSHLKKKKETM